MEIAGAVVQLVECMSPSIAQRWKDHKGVHENMRTLKQKLEELNSRKRDIESRVTTEHIEGRTELKNEVKNWLECVEKCIEEVNGIDENARTVKFCSRASLGKKTRKKIVEIEELYGKGTFHEALVIPLPNRGDLVPTTATIGGETYKQKMEEIWACLLDDEVTKIGVYGMGGIGKTTALEHLHNRLLQDQKDKFDNVIWVTVSKDSNVENLQDKIASKLGLNISNDIDNISRAAKLLAAFGRKKRYVLILDDLWEAYSLKDIGIPEPTPQTGCKLVLTTRSHEVCRLMGCKPIPVELLSKEETLNLFLDIVGRDILSMPNLMVTVEKVAQECAGLPLAIVTIAGSLKGVFDQNEWEIALEDLIEATKGSKSDEIFKRLKFSYDRLNDKKLQDCLLYCSLYPEDYRIERNLLVEHLVVEGIIEERKTRQSEIKKGQVMLNKLVDVCLLNVTSDSGGNNCVKMHDLIRDMALQITSDSPLFLVKAGVRLKVMPDEENWKSDLVRASLMDNDIRDIPSRMEPPNCPSLLTLFLSKSFSLRSISDNFFLHMRGLTVLDMSDNRLLRNIPESVCDLVNLTALFIGGCINLEVVPSLAKLRELRKLDFNGSGIKEVPKGMEMLIKLRYIDFCGTCIEIIPEGILCKLTSLQYLSLDNAGDFNELRESDCAPKVRGEELECMRKLESFEGQLYDINSLNAYVKSLEHSKLTSYVLQLGYNVKVGINIQFNKSVVLMNCDLRGSVASGGKCPLLLPKDVEALFIWDCAINVQNLCELTSFDNVTNFRDCTIVRSCNKMEHVFSNSASIDPLLQSLETLILYELPNLRGLITTADYVEDKKGEADHHAVKIVTLPKLRKLVLFDLPQLQSMLFVADSLQEIELMMCPKLKRLPMLDRPCPPHLQRVMIGESMWNSLEWDHHNAKEFVQSLRT